MDINNEVLTVLKENGIRHAEDLAKKICSRLQQRAADDELVKAIIERMETTPSQVLNSTKVSPTHAMLALGVAAGLAYLMRNK